METPNDSQDLKWSISSNANSVLPKIEKSPSACLFVACLSFELIEPTRIPMLPNSFLYSSPQQQELDEHVVANFPHNPNSKLMADGNPFDVAVMCLSNLWTRIARSTNEERAEVHKLQFQLVQSSLGVITFRAFEDVIGDLHELSFVKIMDATCSTVHYKYSEKEVE